MRPSTIELAHALRQIGTLLGADRADYRFEGRFSFGLADGWSLVISADDAGRFRLEACRASRVRATLWCRVGDWARLESLVLSAQQEAAALAA